jgi:ubiquinone/menaquinone biosynthesis C-methylase UbiE/peptidoglycan/xylan/chitin deacetylase (PgdA/CDA1 family)
MKYLIIKILFMSGADKLFLKFFRAPRIFLYHGVISKEATDGIANYRRKHILKEDFEGQIEFFRSNFQIVSVENLLETLKNDPAKARRMAAITFDDGYENVFKNAWPTLKKHQVPFSIFLPTDFVDKRDPLWVDRLEYAVGNSKANVIDTTIIKDGARISYDVSTRENKIHADTQIREYAKSIPDSDREVLVNDIVGQCGAELRGNVDTAEVYSPLTWDQIREMAKSGLVTVGSHTKSHAIASRITKEEFREELEISKKIIEDKLGISCEWFAYPNGKRKDFSADFSKIIEQSGFKGSLSTEMKFCDKNMDVFAIPRIALDETNDMARFFFTISGARIFFRELRELVLTFLKKFAKRSHVWREDESIAYFHDTAKSYELAYESETPRGYSFRIRREKIMEDIKRLPRGSKILDIGCGPAVYTRELLDAGFEVWGIDPAEDMINISKQRFSNFKKAHFSVGKVEELAFTNGFFDAIIAAGLFEYIDDIESSLREVNRVLRRGGLLVATFPHFWSAPRVWDRVAMGFLGRIKGFAFEGKPKMNSMEFKVKDTLAMMESRGFKPNNVKFYNTRILWTPADRFFPRLAAKVSRACEKFSPSCLKTGFIVYAIRK